MADDSARASRARKPTIYDVARLAGVNPSTVSRALNQPGRINARTQARILDAAAELNYRINPLARALPTGRTNTIALLLADITNPVIFGIVRGAERAAAERGFTLVVAESQESGEREASVAQRVQPSVDGIILGTTRLDDARIVEIADAVPVVVINREVDGVPGVVPDVAPGVDEAVAHLAGLGHRLIAYASGPADSWMDGARLAALTAAASREGVEVVRVAPSERAVSTGPTIDAGRDALAAVLGTGASAVVAYNDLMAIGVLREAAATGVAVPGRLSVVGFDDIFGSDFTTPTLTTVRSPVTAAGERAVAALIGSVLGEETDAADGVLSTELVVRDSTGPAASA